MHACTGVLTALPLSRHGESAAADLVASSLGLSIPVLSIEGARTYAPGISTGAVAVFRAFSTPSPATFAGQQPPPRAQIVCLLFRQSIDVHILWYLARVAASCRRLAEWFHTVV